MHHDDLVRKVCEMDSNPIRFPIYALNRNRSGGGEISNIKTVGNFTKELRNLDDGLRYVLKVHLATTKKPGNFGSVLGYMTV